MDTECTAVILNGFCSSQTFRKLGEGTTRKDEAHVGCVSGGRHSVCRRRRQEGERGNSNWD